MHVLGNAITWTIYENLQILLNITDITSPIRILIVMKKHFQMEMILVLIDLSSIKCCTRLISVENSFILVKFENVLLLKIFEKQKLSTA